MQWVTKWSILPRLCQASSTWRDCNQQPVAWTRTYSYIRYLVIYCTYYMSPASEPGVCKVRNNYHHNHFLFCSSRFLINLAPTPLSHTCTLSIWFRRHCMYNHRVYNRIVIRLTWAVGVLILFTFMAFLYFSLDVVMDYAIMKTNPRIT